MTDAGLPQALENLADIEKTIAGRSTAFFLDFDGTIAPIVPRPDMAMMPEPVREVLRELAADHVVGVVSGRDLNDLRRRVDLDDLYYAGDHGYRIAGPPHSGVELEVGGLQERLELETASYDLERRLRSIAGVVVETKGTSLSVHYRLVAEGQRPLVERIVHEVAGSAPSLKLTRGKLVHELRPHLPWDKGRAVVWILGQLRLRREEICPICVGDDLTDEDMFAAVDRWGLGVIVGDYTRATRARYRLDDPAQVTEFLRIFAVKKGDKPLEAL